MSESDFKLAVYFDGSCPICREEINALAMADVDGRLNLIDCASSTFNDPAAAQAGLDANKLLSAMHVRTEDGLWHKEADAFVLMYEAIGFESAARFFRRSSVRRLFLWLYPVFIRHRHALSYVGAHKLMPWLIRRAARQRAARTSACATNRADGANK